MASTIVTQYLVRPDDIERCPWSDPECFDLRVVRRWKWRMDEVTSEEWSVCAGNYLEYGFTKKGKHVYMRGGLNRRHAVFDLETALQLAADIAEGRVVTDGYYRVFKSELIRTGLGLKPLVSA